MSLFQRGVDSTWRSPWVTLCRVLHHVSLSASECADNVDLRALLGKKKKAIHGQRTWILLNNNGLFFKMSRGFSFFMGRWGFAFIGYFSARNTPKITTELNQHIRQALWSSPKCSSWNRRCRRTKWKWSTKSRCLGNASIMVWWAVFHPAYIIYWKSLR